MDDTLDRLTLDLALEPTSRENDILSSVGLINAPATFQRLMEVVLAGLAHSVCVIYLDDILVFGKTVASSSTATEDYASNQGSVILH